MSMPEVPIKPPSASTWASPLGIIALFLTATETVTGLAVTQAHGGVQVALTCYVIALPLLVLAVFGAILWVKPFVLYPPDAYGPSTTVKDYVDAMQSRYAGVLARREVDESTILAIVHKALESATVRAVDAAPLPPPPAGAVTRSLEVPRAGDAILATIDEQLLTIETWPISGSGKVRKIPFDAGLSVEGLLDDLSFSVADRVGPHSYGRRWVLQDTDSGEVFSEIGRAWARGRGMATDRRKLGEVGLRAGMRLRMIPPPVGP